MAILKMFSVHDDAVKDFGAPQCAKTHGEAERGFKAAVNNPQSGHLHTSPEQFTLFYVGEYDTETGVVEPLKSPQAVVKAIQLKAKPEGAQS